MDARTATQHFPILTTLALFFLATISLGQPEWEAAYVEKGFYPNDICSFDYENDGDNDLIVLDLSDASLLLFEWTGEDWLQHKIYEHNGTMFHMDNADIDLDGDQDLVVSDGMLGLFWLERAGDEWIRHTILDNDWYHASLEIADMDGDGDLDIVANCFSELVVEWWENNQDDWTVHTVTTEFQRVRDIAVADLNNDGITDIIIAADNSGIHWFEVENGIWTAHAVDTEIDASVVEVGDIDGDGRIDIVADGWNHFLCWWENTTDGWIENGLMVNQDHPESIHVDDFDSDGDTDIMGAWGDQGGRVILLENLGSQFSLSAIAYTMDGLSSMEVADFNDDGFVDFSVISDITGLTCFVSDDLYSWDRSDVVDGYIGSTVVGGADFDGDGDGDIIANYGFEALCFWENTGDGWERSVIHTDEYPWGIDIHMGDLNQNGIPDFVSSPLPNGRISGWELVQGIWSLTLIDLELDWISEFEIVDLDADGDNDVLAGGYMGLNWCEYLWGVWVTHQIVEEEWMLIEDINVADINGDGSLNPVAITFYGDISYWSLEDEEWTRHFVGYAGNQGSSVLAANFDEDQNTEILTGSGDAVLLWSQDANDIWTSQPAFPGINRASDLELADIDGDDRLDVIVTSGDGVVWAEQGTDGWETQLLYNESVGAYCDTDVVDVDLDGDMDLVVAFMQTGLVWLEQVDDNFVAHELNAAQPQESALHPNYPNPFNPTTELTFTLARPGHTTLAVFDVTGREVVHLVDGLAMAGTHQVTFDGSGLASGLYFARLIAPDGSSRVQRMVLLQ